MQIQNCNKTKPETEITKVKINWAITETEFITETEISLLESAPHNVYIPCL